MKKKIFSRGLFVEGLRQLRLSGIIFLAFMLAIGVAIPVISQISYLSYTSMYSDTFSPEIVDFQSMCFMVVMLPFVVAPVFTFSLFGAFNKRSSSDFYHSLPYTRICLFNSFAASILAALAAIGLIYCGVTIVTYACLPHLFIPTFAAMWDVLLTVLVQILMVVFAVIMAMSITGTLIANVTSACLIIFLPRLLITMVTLTLGELAPIVEGHYGIFGMEYNVIWGVLNAVFGMGGNSYSDNLWCDLYSLLVAVAYGVLALLLFVHRKSETAGHAAPGRRVQSVIRICVGFVISSVVTCGLIMDFEIAAAVILYPISVIVYFAYELITQKTFKTIPRTIPGLFVLVGLNLLVVAFCVGGASLVHSYTPAVSDVKAIYIEAEENYYDYELSFRDYAADNASSIRIEDKEALGVAVKALKDSAEASASGHYWLRDSYDPETGEVTVRNMTLTYVSSSGIRRTRNIRIETDDYKTIFDSISDNEEYKKKFVELPDAINRTITVNTSDFWGQPDLTDEECMEIYKSIQSEVKEISFGDWMAFLDHEGRGDFELRFNIPGETRKMNLNISAEVLPKSTALLIEKANNNSAEDIELVYRSFEDYADIAKDYLYFNIMMSCDDWELYYYRDGAMESDEELCADLKRLGEAMKKTELDINNYVTVNIELAVEGNNDFGGEEWRSFVVFLPMPADFEPESDAFYVFDEGIIEEGYEIKYEYVY